MSQSRPLLLTLMTTMLVAVGLLLWWQLRDVEPAFSNHETLEQGRPLEQESDATENPDGRAERETIASGTIEKDPATQSFATHPATLIVRVMFSEANEPAAGIGVGLQEVPKFQARRPSVWLRADAKGELRREGITAYQVIVQSDRNRGIFEVAKMEPGKTTEVVLELKDGIHLRGIVVDAAGAPVVGADVLLCEWAGQEAHAAAISDASGRFELRQVGSTVNVGARKAGFAPSLMRTIMASKGAAFDVKIRLPGAGGGVRGRVVDIDGQAIAAAKVKFGYLGFDGRGISLPDGTRGMYPRPIYTRSDADGNFEVVGLATGENTYQVQSDDYAPFHSKVDVEAHITTAVTVQLHLGAICEGTVLDEKGEPLPRIAVRHGQHGRPEYRDTMTDENGAFRLTGLPSAEIELKILTEKYGSAAQKFDVRSGETFRWDVKLSRGIVISGRVTDEAGKPIPKSWFQVTGTQKNGEIWFRHFVTDDDEGSYEIVGAPPDSTITVTLRAREHAPIIRRRVHTSTRKLDFKLKYEGKPTARIIGKLIDPDLEPIADAQLSLAKKDDPSGSGGLSPVQKDGSILLERLRPGTYQLRVRAGALPNWRSEWFELAPGATHDLGEVHMRRGGKARFDVSGSLDDSPVAFQVFEPDGKTFVLNIARSKPPIVSGGLLAGTYIVRAVGSSTIPLQKRFTIKASEITPVSMPVRTGTPVAIWFARLDGDEPPSRVKFTITGADGFRYVHYAYRHRDGHYQRSVGLAPGEYELVAHTDQDHRGARTFTVGSPRETPARIETPLK